MQIAVVSDIHSNLAALEAVLAAIDQEEPDEIWCLGDVVGYGPKPNECCALVRARADICLGGNHDLAVRGTIDLDEFSGDAAVAARWTAGVLTDESRALSRRRSSRRASAPTSPSTTAARATRSGSTCSPTRPPPRRSR